MRYAFSEQEQPRHSVRLLCHVMRVHPSGYYAWKANPISARELDNQRLLPKLKQAWLESGGIYGYRKITLDMRDLGEGCGKHRVYGLLKREGLRSQTGYKRRPGGKSGPPAVVAPNHLQQVFTVSQPNQAWVTDITYIRTHEGWLYLAVVLDLYSRQVVGWSMGSRIDTDLVLAALLMAIWRRGKPDALLHHSDQGSQYTSEQFQRLMADQGITCSMSRSGNCWDNAAMESFFSSLKTERIARKTYRTRDEAKADVFDYIERFYNPKRRHSTIGYMSPMDFEAKAGLG